MTISQAKTEVLARPARARFAFRLFKQLLIAAAVILVLAMILPNQIPGGIASLYNLVVKLFFYVVAPIGITVVAIYAGWSTFPQTRDQNPGLGLILTVVSCLVATGLFIMILVGGVSQMSYM